MPIGVVACVHSTSVSELGLQHWHLCADQNTVVNCNPPSPTHTRTPQANILTGSADGSLKVWELMTPPMPGAVVKPEPIDRYFDDAATSSGGGYSGRGGRGGRGQVRVRGVGLPCAQKGRAKGVWNALS